MDHFNYQHGVLYVEQIPLQEIAQTYGSPCYVYSRATLERHWQAFDDAFAGSPHLICYAVKANPNLAILNLLARLGSGFDIVSIGELERVIQAGGDPKKVVFSGVGKQVNEMQRALQVGIHCFNVESTAELTRLNQIAADMGCKAPASLRVNPDVNAGTHPYISTGLKENKFGIDIATAYDLYCSNQYPHIQWIGVDCHIGSQITTLPPFRDAVARVFNLVQRLQTNHIQLQHIDVGGGLGIRYSDETPPTPSNYIGMLKDLLSNFSGTIIMEPGRAIVGNAGILLTQVEYLKTNQDKHFAIIDAAMNDLLRPSLYQAYQEIIPVKQHSDAPLQSYDIVGPICETGDFLGKNRHLALQAGDLLAVRSAGAYGASMSSTYNSRPRLAELMVDHDQVHIICQREQVDALFNRECLLPD